MSVTMTLLNAEPSLNQSLQNVNPLTNPRYHRRRRSTDDGGRLLYETYGDYFNMDEQIISPATAEELDFPSHMQLSETVEWCPSKVTTPFFFVLSPSSPSLSRSNSDIHSPTSPLKPGDIPEALSRLLPQPTNSLLEVINVAQSGALVKESSDYNLSEKTPGQRPSNPTKLRGDPRSDLSPFSWPKQIHIRKSNGPVPMSHALKTSPRLPPSSTAEILSPSPRRLPGGVTQLHDPQSRLTSSSLPLPNTQQHSTVLRPRAREARSMEVPSSVPKPIYTRGHVRGRSSPFPLPIHFNFAPSSVPGSATTPYSYF